MYRAAVRFADLQDGGRIYEVGEQYPRFGFSVSDERIKELAGSNNRMGHPLIRAEKPVEAVLSADDKIPAPKQKPARKPRRKAESDA